MKKRYRLKSRLSLIVLCCFVMMILPARIYAAPSASAAEGAVSHTRNMVPEYAVPYTSFELPSYIASHTSSELPAYAVPHTPSELPSYAAPGLPDIKLPSLPENISIPEIHFEPEAEKEKLREALKTMDEMGISPEKLLQRFRDFVDRNTKRSRTKDTEENSARGGTGELDRIGNRIREETEQQIDKAAEQAKKKLVEAAEDQIDQAVDQAKENIKQGIDQK